MADLAHLESGVRAPAYKTNPLNLGQEPPQALPPNTAALSKANAHAALMGTVAQTLGQLPQLLLGNFVKGTQVGTQMKANDVLSGALSGKTPNLPEGTTVTPEGVKYTAPDPDKATQTEQKNRLQEATIAHINAQTKALQESPDDPLASMFGGGTSGGALGDQEQALGTGTSYGYHGDTYGGPKATASTTGPAGNALDSQSLAVSPDIEKQLAAQGYKLGDTVMLNTPSGPVQRRWDDRTAQWDSTGKWSVDDKGRYIPKLGGMPSATLPEDQRLPALSGRFDFHADAKGKPSAYNGVKITGIVPKTEPGALASPEPALPTNVPTGALASNTDALGTDGMPVDATDASEVPPHVAGDLASMNATGGVKVSDSGFHNGPVYKNGATYVEHGEDGGVYSYHSNKGKITQLVLQKPPAQGPVPAKIKAEAMQMGIWKEGMTGEEASKAMEDKQISDGVIPPHLLPAAESMARFVVSHPALKHLPTIREAKEAVDSGLQNPGAGGFSDMALIEGFQRMVNPGATVRTQTMSNMKEAAGWLQQVDPTYQWNKAIQGDKFTPEARARLKTLADDIYNRNMKNATPQLNALKKVAKSYGIGNPDQFIDNIMVLSPMYEGSGAGTPSIAPAATGATPGATAAADPKDQAAINWLQANPNDPKAAGVKASLQAKGIVIN